MSATILATEWVEDPPATEPVVTQLFVPCAPTPRTEPAPLADAAFYGLAGEIVRKIEPHTEADPAAMLVQLLVAFGNCIGRGPHFLVEGTVHCPNEYVAIVDRSSKARKGTSFNRIAGLLESADADWKRDCQAHGLVSGEGIVHAIRDETPGKKEGESLPVSQTSGFSSSKKNWAAHFQQQREENTLTATLRSAWDGKDLRTLAKNSHERSTAPHVFLIGHVTLDELKTKLRGDALSNGFANRFLWIYATRARLLPDGGSLRASDLYLEGAALRKAVLLARTFRELRRDQEAGGIWRDAYAGSSEERTGTVWGRDFTHGSACRSTRADLRLIG